jgi:cathepsin A (carboxypeptidase C)
MKVVASTLLLGAASAAFTPPVQQILNNDRIRHTRHVLSKPFHDISESLKSVPDHVREAWTEVSMLFPEAIEQATTQIKPKAHNRKPDSEWDHVLKGADVQSVWVENNEGLKERELDGQLGNYNLRAKKVDPSKLGVDPTVKQYSGYLDDEDEDKHLFYCEQHLS